MESIILITEMNHVKAKEFFLKPQNYFSKGLPSYFDLRYLLKVGIETLDNKELEEKESLLLKRKYSDCSNINYILQTNKSKESYRPLTLLHPYIYVDLVNFITKEENWNELIDRFKKLKDKINEKIECKSLPFINKEKNSNIKVKSIILCKSF
ncbi:hypothetical protein [Atopobacter phocae]|uniref:hypothetical protein n=1 Tax=Atopobacter phocae TaxID=136492 RepID=UPI00046EB09E|nr:hypothetical protein [Atopobacter phocae]